MQASRNRDVPWPPTAPACSSLAVASLILLEACHSSSDDDGTRASAANTARAQRRARRAAVELDLRCAGEDAAGGGTAIALQRVFSGLTFNQPLAMLQAPGDGPRWFVLEKGSGSAGTARVRVFANTPNVTTASNFLSLTVNASSEGGLLGMAFHPQWATNRQVFVSYTEGTPMVSIVARYTSTDGGLTLDPATRQDIIRVNQPFDNHNGGHIAFGRMAFCTSGSATAATAAIR